MFWLFYNQTRLIILKYTKCKRKNKCLLVKLKRSVNVAYHEKNKEVVQKLE